MRSVPSLLVATGLAVGVNGQAEEPVAPVTCEPTANYPGWDGIEYAFIFGDSYTSTGFNVTLEQPSPSNPMGNPPYPGWNSANGPNWVDFLTVKYNESMLMTYNLAHGGATVDSELVAPYLPTVLSLKDQVQDLFLPNYAAGEEAAEETPVAAPAWTGSNSIFAFWFGINDVGNSFPADGNMSEMADLYNAIFDVYGSEVQAVRESGARNFVFLNVPPVDRSPLTLERGQDVQAAEREAIDAFNRWIVAMAESLKASKDGDEVNVWVYDSHLDFTSVLDEPTRFEPTKGYVNIDEYCKAYENGTPEWDTMDESCAAAVDEYFWLNSLHPTYPMHELVAKRVAELLQQSPNVCGILSTGDEAETALED